MADRSIPGGPLILVALLGGVIWFVYDRAPIAVDRCDTSKILVKDIRLAWKNPCSGRPCAHLAGVATLSNKCAEPVGIEVRITGIDANDKPVATRTSWPASVSNIPVGDYTFSLDHLLDFDPRIKSFSVTVDSVRRW